MLAPYPSSFRLSVATLLASAALVAAGDRKFTVTNKCSYTVWPAIFTGGGNTHPDVENGWEAAPGSSRDFNVPDTWTAGRIWARTDCNFDGSGAGSCLTGNCFGGLVCDQTQGYGMAPASLAEFTFGQGTPGVDWYDVSIVDGTNVPISIELSNKCSEASCPMDLNAGCPAELQGPLDAAGAVSSCKSACVANLDGNAADSANCCTGSHADRGNCPSSGVKYYDYFKKACPNSYAYAFDEDSGTAMYGCDTNAEGVPDYSIVFCPNGDDGNGAPAPAPAPSPAPDTTPAPDSTSAPAPDSTSAPTSDPTPIHAPGPVRPPTQSEPADPTEPTDPTHAPGPVRPPPEDPTSSSETQSSTSASETPVPTDTTSAPQESSTTLPTVPTPAPSCAKKVRRRKTKRIHHT